MRFNFIDTFTMCYYSIKNVTLIEVVNLVRKWRSRTRHILSTNNNRLWIYYLLHEISRNLKIFRYGEFIELFSVAIVLKQRKATSEGFWYSSYCNWCYWHYIFWYNSISHNNFFFLTAIHLGRSFRSLISSKWSQVKQTHSVCLVLHYNRKQN